MSSFSTIYDRVIRPSRKLEAVNFSELWFYRELFWQLAWRNVLVRYKQTAIGLAWAVLQPLLTMIIFTVLFEKVAKLPSGGAPYAMVTFAALLPWQFFSNAVTTGSGSLVSSQNLITKIYFPRLLIPASAVAGNAIDFGITLVLMFMLMAWYAVGVSPLLLLLPFFFALTAAAALGLSLWLGALNVKYRDVSHVVPFLTRIGLYVSPVGFISAVIPEKYKLAYYTLNPMAGFIDGFRWSILGAGYEPWWPGLLSGSLVTLLVLITGAYYFRSAERRFADII
ncbi:MAG: type transporter [Verrucomicrobia bacterium]|jgi:lipopolysaccharide transport system permease protein|nr:type transporter [Verrucomicrobiota bacterium]